MNYASGKMLAEVTDGVGLITFNQPEKRNAMSVEMWEGMAHILRRVGRGRRRPRVVLTGAGDKAFVSGADISQFGETPQQRRRAGEYDRLTSAGRARLAEFPKPVIARIRGFCLGGGLAIAMQADLRIASDDSAFGIPAAKLGIAYGFDMVRQAELPGRAGERAHDAVHRRAHRRRGGAADRPGQPRGAGRRAGGHGRSLARTIAGNAPLSVRGDEADRKPRSADPADRDMSRRARRGAACFDSADYTEGRTAFMEKRRPRFQGR